MTQRNELYQTLDTQTTAVSGISPLMALVLSLDFFDDMKSMEDSQINF